MLVFDIETDGFLRELTKVHCLVIKDTETGGSTAFNGVGSVRVEVGLELLMHRCEQGGSICGHNVIKFDIPALQKVYPWFKVDPDRVLDTLVLSRLIYPDTKPRDQVLVKKGKLPANLQGRHSLEAWGHRIGEYKGDFKGPWDTWTQEMEDYCVQDVEVTANLLAWLKARQPHLTERDESERLEHEVAWIIARQERYGWRFNEQKAAKLYGRLVQRREELGQELRSVFKPWYVKGETVTPKTSSKPLGRTKGAAYTKIEWVEFNPNSRDHVADRLKVLFGWEPELFTPSGKPQIDDAVISQIDIPQAAPLKEYFMVQKRIGQVAEGDQAWLKAVRQGRIHGSVNTNGAVTGRMTHFGPNIAQVPGLKDKKTGGEMPYGYECRELFEVGPGKVQVGCDADALELRDLAGYMAKFDGGAYVDTVLRGDKKQGTDMHSVNCRALGFDPKLYREKAKTWFYAFIYGAGDEKLGAILTGEKGKKAVFAGKKSRAAFLRNLPALGRLVELVRQRAKARGFLVGLDGRRLEVRSQHAALNTLLQSAGAIQMKKALVILDRDLQAAGLTPGVHYEFLANIHDEWQIEVDEDKGETVGQMAAEAIRKSGEHFRFGCPLAGESKYGRNWAETH